MILGNSIHIDEDTLVTFTDLSWNECIGIGMTTGGNYKIVQGGPIDHNSHLPIPVAMSGGDTEYIDSATACMRAIYLRMLTYDVL